MQVVNLKDLYVRQTSKTQKPPYITPLPYEVGKTIVNIRLPSDYWDMASSFGTRYWGYESPAAYSTAYSKFMSQVSSQASWGENLAQYKEGVELATSLFHTATHPAQTIAKALQSLGRGWGTTPRQLERMRRNFKAANDAYLAWVYGLNPAISDIKEAIKLIDPMTVPPIPVKGRGREQLSFTDSDDRNTRFVRGFARAQIKGSLEITNPNLLKARALGLTNPVATAWDLIPFSFVFDQFYDIGKYLHGLDSLFGVKLINGAVTYYNSGFGLDQYIGTTAYHKVGFTWMWMRRTPTSTIPLPRPYVNLKLSTWRVVHDLSLLAGLTVLK